jgi:hypothetical protein
MDPAIRCGLTRSQSKQCPYERIGTGDVYQEQDNHQYANQSFGDDDQEQPVRKLKIAGTEFRANKKVKALPEAFDEPDNMQLRGFRLLPCIA